MIRSPARPRRTRPANSGRRTGTDSEDYYGGGPGFVKGDSDSDASSRDSCGDVKLKVGSDDEVILADVSYWNGPMPLTKQERRERDRKDRRKTAPQEGREGRPHHRLCGRYAFPSPPPNPHRTRAALLTPPPLSAVPVTIVTAPLWLPMVGPQI